MTTGDAERVSIESGAAGPGWSATGFTFIASSAGSDDWKPVCRFYGPNSHFYTIDAVECERGESRSRLGL
jgi:hypothetical protein